MITILIIVVIAMLDSIFEVIRIPEIFKNSIFKKYIGNRWIDPQVSWENKNKVPKIFQSIWVCFSDLIHLLRFLIRLLWICFAISFYYSELYPPVWIMIIIWWFIYYFIFELFYSNMKKNNF